MDLLKSVPGPKELVEKASMSLVEQKPHLFAVDKPLNDKYLALISAKTNLVVGRNIFELSISLTKNKVNGEVAQEILLTNHKGQNVYKLSVTSGPKLKEEKERLQSFLQSNPETPESVIQNLGDVYGTSGSTIVSRYDMWPETEISADEARKIIETGKLQLPKDAKVTLKDLQQKEAKSFLSLE